MSESPRARLDALARRIEATALDPDEIESKGLFRLATPLYRLDFATPAAESRAPLRVTFERADFDEDPERETSETVLRREAMREAFAVTELEDAEGTAMKPAEVKLRLHTLGFADEYWIDTGLFRL